jgi:hypothetical protein
LELRQKIYFTDRENKTKYDQALVIEQFNQAISTGIRDDRIRIEMNTILKSYDSDEGLLQSLNEITRKLDDRDTKLNWKSTRVAKVPATESNEGTGEAGDALLEAINALRVEVTNLKKDVASAQSSGNGTNHWLMITKYQRREFDEYPG